MSEASALVMLTSSFPGKGDGSEAAGSFVADLAGEMAGHLTIRVVAPGLRPARERWSNGVEVFRFSAPAKPLSTLRPWIPSDLLAIRQVLKAGQVATAAAVRAGPTTHILALWALPAGHWARTVSRYSGIPYSVWALGSDIWTLGRLPFVRGYIRRILRAAHVCYSDGIRLAADTRAICGRQVEFLPSTRSISRNRVLPLKKSPPYRLLFLGRWHPNKGVDLLIRALDLLHDNDWSRIEAVEICGGGVLDGAVQRGIESLRASGRPVAARGYLDKAAAENAILRADYLLIPSRVESIPVVFSDAMKLSCPVIATPVGDLQHLTETKRVGLCADDVTPDAIAQAIRKGLDTSPSCFLEGMKDLSAFFSIGETVVPRLVTLARKKG